MPSMHWQVLALFGVRRRECHADLQFAVPSVHVRRAVLRTLQLHLRRVARQLAQGLRQKQFDLFLVHASKGV